MALVGYGDSCGCVGSLGMWWLLWDVCLKCDVVTSLGCDGFCGSWWFIWDNVAHVGCGGSCGIW